MRELLRRRHAVAAAVSGRHRQLRALRRSRRDRDVLGIANTGAISDGWHVVVHDDRRLDEVACEQEALTAELTESGPPVSRFSPDRDVDGVRRLRAALRPGEGWHLSTLQANPLRAAPARFTRQAADGGFRGDAGLRAVPQSSGLISTGPLASRQRRRALAISNE